MKPTVIVKAFRELRDFYTMYSSCNVSVLLFQEANVSKVLEFCPFSNKLAFFLGKVVHDCFLYSSALSMMNGSSDISSSSLVTMFVGK